MDPRVAECCEAGEALVESVGKGPTVDAFTSVASSLESEIGKLGK